MNDDILAFGKSRWARSLPFDVIVRDAQEQQRTPCDVPAGRRRVRPRVPSKALGRRGTRRAWKRRRPPYWAPAFRYREPTDVLVLAGSARSPVFPGGFQVRMPDLWVVTPAQHKLILEAAALAEKEVR